jgi:hypothetical protein
VWGSDLEMQIPGVACSGQGSKVEPEQEQEFAFTACGGSHAGIFQWGMGWRGRQQVGRVGCPAGRMVWHSGEAASGVWEELRRPAGAKVETQRLDRDPGKDTKLASQ